MFDFLKRKKNPDNEVSEVPASSLTPPENSKENKGFFSRLKEGLSKTRHAFTTQLGNLFLGKKELDAALFEELETLLLSADVGFETTEQLIKTLTDKLARKELANAEAALLCLKDEMKRILKPSALPFTLALNDAKPFVILMVGINGSGKTTTIGKLAHQFKSEQKSVLLAAGDTFRAAAIAQLETWGERNTVPVIAQQPGADTAAVIYDALEAAKARQYDIMIADTAGRLHTQTNLMHELQKVKRVLKKLDETAPHEVFIVLDATLGQNTLQQVKEFHEAIGVSGVILTKLDGTAKGGIVFALAQQTNIPIRYIGIGEKITDLRPFNAEEYVDALFTP